MYCTKKMIIKALSVILAVMLTFTAAPLSGFVGLELPEWLDFSIMSSAVTSGTCGENLTWTLDYTTGTLTISGSGGIYPVIDDNGYEYTPWGDTHLIKTIVIDDGITAIGDDVFSYYYELTNVIIGNSVEYIGYYAFGNCSSLTSITFGNSLKTIGQEAFANCNSLTSITIPDSVTSIGGDAFSFCINLTGIMVDDNNQNYSNDEYGVLFNKDKTSLIRYPAGNTRTSYTIPESVTIIRDRAFYKCRNLMGVTIPDGIKIINESTFSYCTSLISVTIPNSVTTIDYYAFEDCTSLTNIIIPDSVISIKYGVFSYCKSLTSITIPDSVTSIGINAFENCTSLTDVYYCGTEEQWNAVEIDSTNTKLLNATLHYHKYVSEVTESTCLEKGYTTYTCEFCGDSYKDNYTDTIEHEFESVVTESTETQSGYTSYICSVCNQETLIFVDSTNYVEGIIYKSNSVKDILSVLNSDNSNYKIFDANGNELTDDDLVGTKSTINIYDNETNKLIDTHTVIVYGDVNGDGLIDNSDSDIIAAVATCKAVIDDELFHMAADTNHDGAVDGFDVIETELQELDMHNIDQKNTAAYLPKDEDDDSAPSVGTDDPDGDGWWGDDNDTEPGVGTDDPDGGGWWG